MSLSQGLETSSQTLSGNQKYAGIYRSPYLEEIFLQITRIAAVMTTTLISGESGTGKDIVARMIHMNSNRKNKPYITVNCGAIPDNLFESEMFGIEKGVATGVDKRIGYIEQAHTGTLFLDEVGEMSLDQQVKLLRIIESRKLRRIGSPKTMKIDLRLITATNKNLRAEVEQGNFREDLFYRLHVINIDLPPLRKRKNDIVAMAYHFLAAQRQKLNRPSLEISQEAAARLTEYHWPGNCRELNNEMERASVLAASDTVQAQDLSRHIIRRISLGKKKLTIEDTINHLDLPLNLKNMEEVLVLRSLEITGNNKSEAARLLGLTREGLRKKLIRLELG
ncbi:MAG: sigma-54-dependent Fis family transcriptional regulator [Desulfobacteraceae bacterium]|nr:sigma-54-dependent Fis family transcriptional regulator [Desulfobacteraceae bacterium]